MEILIGVMVVVVVCMVWCLWKWFLYPIFIGAYLSLTSADPDNWYVIKRTYNDTIVRFKVGGANIAKFKDASYMDYQVNGRDVPIHCKLDIEYKSLSEVEDLIKRCKAAYVYYQQKVANTRVVKEEVV